MGYEDIHSIMRGDGRPPKPVTQNISTTELNSCGSRTNSCLRRPKLYGFPCHTLNRTLGNEANLSR